MRFSRLLILSSLLFAAFTATAQSPDPASVKQPRILILLDGSSSMLQPWQGGQSRFSAAGRIVEALMDSVYHVNSQVEFGLRVYGHQHTVAENNCFDTRREVMFSKNNIVQMGLRMASLHPSGVSPIAYSLQQAAENDMVDEQNNSYSLILITDGGESCGGDLCKVAADLLARKILFKPYILSLVDYQPLAQQYDCLGKYLTVAKEQDIKATVGSIVDAYRKALTLAKAENKPIKTTAKAVSIPSVLRIPTPAVTLPATYIPPATATPAPAPKPVEQPKAPEPEPLPKFNLVVLSPARAYRSFPVYYSFTPPPRLRIARVPLPQVVNEAVEINGLTANTAPKGIQAKNTSPVTATRVQVANVPLPVAVNEPVELQAINPNYTKQAPAVRTVAANAPRTRLRIRAIPLPLKVPIAEDPVVSAEQAPTPPPAPKPVPATKPLIAAAAPPEPKPASTTKKPAGAAAKQPETAPMTSTTEAASESLLEVYFTNGRGKFYATTPVVFLNDPVSGKNISKFFRTTDAGGRPDPQKIPPGTYSLVVGNGSTVVRGVVIKPNEKNKVTVTVTNGSLRFSYAGNAKRKVEEFEAVVVRRFADDRSSMRQPCTEELPYEPGNYYLEINTNPITRRNLDINFGSTTDITIAEPGFVQFTNGNNLGKISLFQPLNDGFFRFYDMRITGNPEAQKLRLQPGTYEAHWLINPDKPFPEERKMQFRVTSNATEAVELK